MSLALTLSWVTFSWAQTPAAVVEESLYHHFQTEIQSSNKSKLRTHSGFSSFEQSLFVDALWDLAEAESPEALAYLNIDTPVYYTLVEKLRLGILRIKYHSAKKLPLSVSRELTSALRKPKPELKLIYLVAAYESLLLNAGHTNLVKLARKNSSYFEVSRDDQQSKLPQEMVADLYHQTPDVATYMNGEYSKSVKILMFCRNNRLYPCLMIMKDVFGLPVRKENGKLWSSPSLASSSKGLPSYIRNGNTPEGIYTIDSVMPHADEQISFGKFRRMVLNFIPKSKDEVLLKSLLPESSKKSDWWKSSAVSRDMGRNLFRIHGTGKVNPDPATPYFPFMRTSGCVAQKENTYDGVTYVDQRNLLDSIMVAMDLAPVFENEPQIKGLLYVMEIDDKNAPVTLQDLALRGIE